MSQKQQNPIIEIYKGRAVRKYNTIELKVSVEEYMEIIDLSILKNKTKTDIVKTTPVLCRKNY